MFYGALYAFPDVSDWNVSSVWSMSGMFYNSNASSDVSRWNVNKVHNMRSMFEGAVTTDRKSVV